MVNQYFWPFGPAPTRECVAGDAHDWKVIDLFRAADPPVPSFECTKCKYRWTRGWTKAEFQRVILKGETHDTHYGDGSNYPDEPTYCVRAE